MRLAPESATIFQTRLLNLTFTTSRNQQFRIVGKFQVLDTSNKRLDEGILNYLRRANSVLN